MNVDLLRESFEVLSRALPPDIELGMPWPRDQGWDEHDSPMAIHEASSELGGQALLTGGLAEVNAFLDVSRRLASPRVIAFWLRGATFFANDGGLGLQRRAREWRGDSDSLKRYIGALADHLVDPDSLE